MTKIAEATAAQSLPTDAQHLEFAADPRECAVNDDETLQVLEYLDQCSPRKVEATNLEVKSTIAAYWCLGIAVTLLIIAGLIAMMYRASDVSVLTQVVIQLLILSAMLSALASIVVPVVPMIVLSFRWKALAFQGLCDDIRYERRLQEELSAFGYLARKDAEFWLKRRIKRLSSRTTMFFGEKTAGFGLLATGYTFLSQVGGYDWIADTLTAGVSAGNWLNTALLWIGAAVVGMSIGAIFVGRVVARYRYQLSILQLADREILPPVGQA